MKNFPAWFFDKTDWQEKTLGEVCSYISKRGTCSQTEYVGTENMLQNFSGVNFKDEIEKNFTGISYQVGDILFSNIRPYLKKVWKADKKGCASTDILVIRAEKNIFADFLYYSVANDEFISKVMTSAKGTKMPRGDKNFIMNLKIKFPPLAVQKKIADYFTHLDNAINAQDLKLKSWRDAKKAMLQKIFSQEFYFTQDSGKKYPAWQEKTLGDVVENFTYGLNAKAVEFDGVHKYLRITDIDDTTRKFIQKNLVSPDVEDFDKKFFAVEGDIFLARTGATVGKTFFYKKIDGEIYHAGYLIRARIKKEFEAYFIYLQTLTEEYRKWLKVMSMRTGQPGINAEEYSNLKIKVPCIEEQKKIAEYFSSLDKIIDAENKILENLRLMKRGLLQKLFV